jgi:hypothetical protein
MSANRATGSGGLGPLLGSESVVSEVFSSKRELKKRQIERLSKRFRVSPAAFSRHFAHLSQLTWRFNVALDATNLED